MAALGLAERGELHSDYRRTGVSATSLILVVMTSTMPRSCVAGRRPQERKALSVETRTSFLRRRFPPR